MIRSGARRSQLVEENNETHQRRHSGGPKTNTLGTADPATDFHFHQPGIEGTSSDRCQKSVIARLAEKDPIAHSWESTGGSVVGGKVRAALVHFSGLVLKSQFLGNEWKGESKSDPQPALGNRETSTWKQRLLIHGQEERKETQQHPNTHLQSTEAVKWAPAEVGNSLCWWSGSLKPIRRAEKHRIGSHQSLCRNVRRWEFGEFDSRKQPRNR